ncbi:DUF6279 family lipoprotein [Hydrogenophaga sp. RWCD_12]|uniref:DUF6279 family lipoprotein n=1 Tax=Hydrogenophaga sp. RWCD_12 TaxID=3391190 RepID=UPI0039848630
MNTFPEATKGTSNYPRIIARGLLLALLLQLLSACSMLRLAYGQGPSLAYWWIDGYADLSELQTVQMRKDIDGFFAWHRGSELPYYVTRLQQWQQLATAESNTDLVCAQFDVLRAAYLRVVDRSLEPMARLALTMTPAQLLHLQRKYAKNNQEYERLYIRVNNEERIAHLMDKALERYEPVYGSLNDAQLKLLRERIRQSPFDAVRVNAERVRRQADLIKTLRELQADRSATVATATNALRRWHERVMQSPIPGFAAYSDGLVRNGCEQFAAIHNTTTPEQRTHAVQVLKGYETDLRAVAAPY